MENSLPISEQDDYLFKNQVNGYIKHISGDELPIPDVFGQLIAENKIKKAYNLGAIVYYKLTSAGWATIKNVKHSVGH